MAATAETLAKQLDNTPPDPVELPIELSEIEELFGDIAEIINENFILEVEASRSLDD